jgi:hypothetical protein
MNHKQEAGDYSHAANGRARPLRRVLPVGDVNR